MKLEIILNNIKHRKSVPAQPGLVSLGLWRERRRWWWWCAKHWSLSQPWGPRPEREATLCTHSARGKGKTLPERVKGQERKERWNSWRTITLKKHSHNIEAHHFFLLHLFPGCDRTSREDEDYSGDIQRPPDEESQSSSAAPHRGQPGQADEQDSTQTENHTHNRQSRYMDIDVLWRKWARKKKTQTVE